MCGTEPFPTDFRAKKYKVEKHFLTKVVKCLVLHDPGVQEDFTQIMKNLPVPVEDVDIEEMFTFADRDGDGRLSYQAS